MGDEVADVAFSMTLMVFLGVCAALRYEGLPPTVSRFGAKVVEIVTMFEEQVVEFAAVSSRDAGSLGDGVTEWQDVERWCSEKSDVANSIWNRL